MDIKRMWDYAMALFCWCILSPTVSGKKWILWYMCVGKMFTSIIIFLPCHPSLLLYSHCTHQDTCAHTPIRTGTWRPGWAPAETCAYCKCVAGDIEERMLPNGSHVGKPESKHKHADSDTSQKLSCFYKSLFYCLCRCWELNHTVQTTVFQLEYKRFWSVHTERRVCVPPNPQFPQIITDNLSWKVIAGMYATVSTHSTNRFNSYCIMRLVKTEVPNVWVNVGSVNYWIFAVWL